MEKSSRINSKCLLSNFEKIKKTLQEFGMISLEDYTDFKNHLVRRVKYDRADYKENSAQKIRNYFITKEK